MHDSLHEASWFTHVLVRALLSAPSGEPDLALFPLLSSFPDAAATARLRSLCVGVFESGRSRRPARLLPGCQWPGGRRPANRPGGGEGHLALALSGVHPHCVCAVAGSVGWRRLWEMLVGGSPFFRQP